MEKKLLSAERYAEIVRDVPILCVDLIIVGPFNKFLLVERKNEPMAGQFWIPGGRVMRDEPIQAAAIRLAREEVGLELDSIKLHGIYEEVFEKSAANPATGIHTLSAVYWCVARHSDVKVDDQSASYRWSEELPEHLLTNLKTL